MKILSALVSEKTTQSHESYFFQKIRIKAVLVIGFIGITIGFKNPVLAQTADPLLHQSNLVYQGAFRLPQGTNTKNSFWYGGYGIAYNPIQNSLFIVGHIHHNRTAEISIPLLVNSNAIGDLNTATFLQGFTDALEGKLWDINPPDPNSKNIGGQFVYNNKLIIAGYSYYDGAITQSSSHFSRPLNLSTSGQFIGPVRVGSFYPGWYAGYMFAIPSEWQSLFGGPVMTGGCCWPGASWQSQGPSANVFDPSQIGEVSPVPAVTVLAYQYPNDLGPIGAEKPSGTTTNPIYNLTTRVTGAAFPVGTRSILFFGRHGLGTYCYGTGSECNDPADSSKGTHAYPYKYQVWAYDANHLLAVKKGTKEPYAVQPYSIWNFNLPFEIDGTHEVGGVAYDAATDTIYISAQCVDTSCNPIIHAFKVNIGSASTPLAAPQHLRTVP